MINIRPGNERGGVKIGWLDSRHTFSFGSYYDPERMQFRSLRVINEDRVQPGTGFPTHAHQNMEILTYVLAGEVTHQDSLGNATVIKAGELQRMTAGTGIRHSEYNLSDRDLTHFLQIWIIPDRQNLEPSYEQKQFAVSKKQGEWQLLASQNGRDESLLIHQDVNLYAAKINPKTNISHSLQPERYGWLQVTKGKLTLNGHALEAGDGAAISDETELYLQAVTEAEVLLFDLA